jgi:hypothetical protein
VIDRQNAGPARPFVNDSLGDFPVSIVPQADASFWSGLERGNIPAFAEVSIHGLAAWPSVPAHLRHP